MIEQIQHLLEEALRQDSVLLYFLMFGGGLMASLTPCTYPVLPLTIGYIGHQAGTNRLRVFLMSLSLVTGLAMVYAVLGVAVAAVGGTFGSLMGNGLILYGIALYFLIMGLFLLDVFYLPIPGFLSALQAKSAGRKGIFGAFVIGGISGLIVGPCTGPILAVALGAIALTLKNVQGLDYVLQAAKGGILLFLFGFGQGALILVAGMMTGFLYKLPKAGQWMESVKKGFALLIILTSTLLFVFVGQNTDFPSLTRLLASAESSRAPAPAPRADAPVMPPSGPVAEPGADRVPESTPAPAPKDLTGKPQTPAVSKGGTTPAPESTPKTSPQPRASVAAPPQATTVSGLTANPVAESSPAPVSAPPRDGAVKPPPAAVSKAAVEAAAESAPVPAPMADGAVKPPSPAAQSTPAPAPKADAAAKPPSPAASKVAAETAVQSTPAAAAKTEAAVRPPSRAASTPAVKPAPDFTLVSLEKKERVTLSHLKGKKGVVLVFFATWCVNCMREVPEVKKLAQMAQKENVALFAINYKQSNEIVERFKKSMQVDYEILLDSDGEVTTGDYGINGLPHIVGINARGEMIYRGSELPENKSEFLKNLKQGL